MLDLGFDDLKPLLEFRFVLLRHRKVLLQPLVELLQLCHLLRLYIHFRDSLQKLVVLALQSNPFYI